MIFIVPTMKKLGQYLEEVVDWEKFAYQLLPEEKEHLVEVQFLFYICSLLLTDHMVGWQW